MNAQTGIWPLVFAWGRERGIPDQRRPEYSEVPQRELRNLGLGTLYKPDDDPFLKVWRDGLDRLRGWTRCPALKEDLRSLGWKEPVSVERG